MILRDEKEFTVEIDEEDTVAQSPERLKVFADTVVNVFSKYQLEGTEHGQSVAIEFDGCQLRFCPKKVPNA